MESKSEVNKRKIRNGIRKQAEKLQREKEKIWNRLKDEFIIYKVNRQRMTPQTRQLKASWTIEPAQDLVFQYSDSLMREMNLFPGYLDAETSNAIKEAMEKCQPKPYPRY